MQPFSSYTSLKAVHDQQLQEALKQQRPDAEPKTSEQNLLQALGKFLARFHNPSARKQEKPLPGCA
ncbi:MAG: hypothetical protein J2P36_05610 [Ktedonobacteraceae bacterium]|nr:hypothetical protein [Ktedonobacteraceae bacterium]